MRAVWTLTIVLLASCSATPKSEGSGGAAGSTGDAGTATSGGAGSAGEGTGGKGGEGGVGGFGGQAGGIPVGETEVFGHSPDTLYRLDPVTKEVTAVGVFDSCFGDGGVIDIALDKNGSMVGTTFSGLYNIDKTTAKCSLVASGDLPNSLSFVPAGTLDPDVEALVGFEGSNYVRIDPATGIKTIVNQYALGTYTSSGDVVSVIGGGTYVTVFGGPENCFDCILQIDPATGELIQNIGALDYGAVYGLAFWGGAAYGFAGSSLFQIDLMTAMTTEIPQPNAPAELSYNGAGSSTSAPLEPPQ